MLQSTIEKIFEDLKLISKKKLFPFNRPILQQIYDDEDKINLFWAYFGKEDEEEIYSDLDEEEIKINKIWIQVKKSISQELAQNSSTKRPKVVLSRLYAEYKDIFNKKDVAITTRMMNIGLCYRFETRFCSKGLQSLSDDAWRTNKTQWVLNKKSVQRIYPTIKIFYSLSILLHIQKGFEQTQTLSRLLTTKWRNCQEHLSFATYRRSIG